MEKFIQLCINKDYKEIEKYSKINNMFGECIYLCETNNIEIFKIVFKHNKKLKLKTSMKHILTYASVNDNIEIIEYLIDVGGLIPTINDINEACRSKVSTVVLKLMMENGEYDIENALQLACSIKNNYKVIDFLIKEGAKNFNRALFHPTRTNDIDTVKYLIKLGASNLNEMLLYAINRNYNELVVVFIENGAYNIKEALHTAYEGRFTNSFNAILKSTVNLF